MATDDEALKYDEGSGSLEPGNNLGSEPQSWDMRGNS